MGNGEAKELTCTTHRYKLSRGMLKRMRVSSGRGERGEKRVGQL